MKFFDSISKTVSQGVDRAKFEADKFQKTTRLQGEVNELQKSLDGKLLELGQRAYDLFRAGQISAPSVGALAKELDALRGSLVGKEEELKAAQLVTFMEPAAAQAPVAQQVPISNESSVPTMTTAPSAADQKACPACAFAMPRKAMFCPNCGARQAP